MIVDKSVTKGSTEQNAASICESASIRQYYPSVILEHLPVMAFLEDTDGR